MYYIFNENKTTSFIQQINEKKNNKELTYNNSVDNVAVYVRVIINRSPFRNNCDPHSVICNKKDNCCVVVAAASVDDVDNVALFVSLRCRCCKARHIFIGDLQVDRPPRQVATAVIRGGLRVGTECGRRGGRSWLRHRGGGGLWVWRRRRQKLKLVVGSGGIRALNRNAMATSKAAAACCTHVRAGENKQLKPGQINI